MGGKPALRPVWALCLFALLAIAIFGCGGASDDVVSGSAGNHSGSTSAANDESTSSGEPEKNPWGPWGVAFGAESAEFGIIVFDAHGRTLYTFDRDKGTTSTCYGACAESWPPALAEGKPKAEGGALPGKVGATTRRDGSVQITYGGHPLYYFSGDRGDAEYRGQGAHAFGGRWSVIRIDGETVGG
jgi:predicted lipoprotein with Yx(FWY)xxD motif